jgi:hypothetical protein
MSRVLVQSFAFTNNPSDWACLRETAAKFKVNLRVMGEGRTYPPASEGFAELLEELKERTEPYTVLTDGYDTFFSRWDEDEVADLCDAACGNLICAAEDWCWPPGPWCAYYTGPHKSPWFAANGGGLAGKREFVIAIVEQFRDRVDECQHGNQELLHKLLGEGYPMELDKECRIWQCMHGDHSDLITLELVEESPIYGEVLDVADACAFNSFTGSTPMIMHFNGSVPGMRRWWDACVYTPWPRTPGLKPE